MNGWVGSNRLGLEETLLFVTVRRANLRGGAASLADELVGACGARIVDRRTSAALESYVLSESSLVVWDDRLLMLTCGRADLAASARTLGALLGTEQVTTLRYVAGVDPPEFVSIAADLANRFRGLRADVDVTRGTLVAARPGEPPVRVLRVQAFGLDADCALAFARGAGAAREALAPVFEAFAMEELHDHAFVPQGYSAHAIRGAELVAIHVSPEATQRYASLVALGVADDRSDALVAAMRATFRPARLVVTDGSTTSSAGAHEGAPC